MGPMDERLSKLSMQRAPTELASKSASNAEIEAFSGHVVNSPILQDYVMQTKETALNARRKMGSYLADENES